MTEVEGLWRGVDHKRQELREKLAALEHEQWMEWAKSVWDEVDPVTAIRWRGYFVPYSELTEEVKDHDREWADKILELIEEFWEVIDA